MFDEVYRNGRKTELWVNSAVPHIRLADIKDANKVKQAACESALTGGNDGDAEHLVADRVNSS